MAWSFGDSFDCYAAPADAINGYWDNVALGTLPQLLAGRFAGSRGLSVNGAGTWFTKTSGINDAVHHFVVAFNQNAAPTGSNLGFYLELFDGITAQCSVVFRSDGAILLQSGGPTGTTLATYAGAWTGANTWYAFEFEVVINNATGSFTVRKNGNTSNDFTATGLNTRVSANNYANKLTIGNATNFTQIIDDLFWRSDASSVAWLGDIRCYTRMPASDVSAQFSRVPASPAATVIASGASTISTIAPDAWFAPFNAPFDGTLNSVTVQMAAGYTGNMKCALYNSSGGNPSTVVASATPIVNPATGNNTLTFPSPPLLVKGAPYFISYCTDVSGTFSCNTSGGRIQTTGITYATFPVANPTASSAPQTPNTTITQTLAGNFTLVNEAQEDGLTTYVYDSTVNDADFYSIGTIASTPASTIAVTTRGYMQKSDAGSRTASVQLKSGATTVATPTLTLTTSGWQWAWRTDITDPNTSAAWSAAAVAAVNVGPKVVS
jgi:hypothetical protein